MTVLEKERDRIRKDEPRTLKNLDKLIHAGASMLEVYNYLEDIMNNMREIKQAPITWWGKNLEGIMSRFDLHSASGIKPEELLVYFIEKEVLG
jgi:hypothetical protein